MQDILWIQEAIAGDASRELTLTRSARLARVGARAARLARMARVLRVLKVVKVTMLAKTTGRRLQDLIDEDDEDVSSVPRSIVEQVSDSVTRHVVAIVLVSVIGAAALQFYEDNQAASAAFAVMTEASASSHLAQTQALEDTLPNMYYLRITEFGDLIDKRAEQKYLDLRDSETFIYKTGPDDDCVDCIAMVDTSIDKVNKAVLNMSLILLIIAVLLSATMSLSRETVQIMLEPTLKVLRMSRSSQALMSVCRAVADPGGKRGLDKTIGVVLDAALKMLNAEVVNIYFVDAEGSIKLHQSARDGSTECTDAKGRLYADELRIADTQTDTVIGNVINDAKQSYGTEDHSGRSAPSYASLLWIPELDGVVDMTAQTSMKRSLSVKRTMSNLAKSSSSAAALKTAQVDAEWTDRWLADPSITSIKLQKAGSTRYVGLVGKSPVRNQLCMAVVAEVAGRHRVVGMVQAFNRRIPKKRERYDGAVQLADLAFNQDDVNSLEVFCMQIADLVQMKLKEAQYEDALNRTDGIGSMLRALELEHDGVQAAMRTPRSPQERASETRTLKSTVEAVKFANRTNPRMSANQPRLPIDQLRRWGHGCLDHSLTELAHYTVQMFEDLGLLTEFQVPEAGMFQFADMLLSSYNQVPYHNAYHAFNVMQGCYVFCSTMNKGKSLLMTEQLALMVSALGHDSGHDGVNNAFHVGCESEIATLYNDLSPLENMHACRTLGMLRREDIMARMAPTERKAIKSMVVSLIIATDMKFHKDKELKLAEVGQGKRQYAPLSAVHLFD